MVRPAGPEGWEALAREARAGNAEAVEALAESLYPPLVNFARRSLGDPGAADDVAQETVLRVVTNLRRYQPGTRFRSWVYRIALNLCRNRATRHRHVTSDGVPEEAVALLPGRERAAGPETLATERDEAARVRRALRELPEPFREVVTLRLWQGLSFAEISESLGVPEGTLKSRMHHAVRKLRDLLGVAPEAVADPRGGDA